MSKSVCDDAFLGAGKKDGIEIWRIEDFKLIKLKSVEYGNVFECFKTNETCLIVCLLFWP